ncbi:hypothetical protein Hypma_003401 [Hypsizygus marmoreus]|uniref:Uncharacterized protein n=1 Tax=Hypsizygus marmoreus TaxID=39966 RepID=A0A369J6R7_HYPMA|nr:hypothetical protein Hypma_003401 [Hypsizygus marmoreus]
MSRLTINPVSLTIGPDTRFSSLQTQLASSDDAELLLTSSKPREVAPYNRGGSARNDRTLKNIVQLDRSLPSTTHRWLAVQPSALQNDVRAGRKSTRARTPGRRRTASVLVLSRHTQHLAQHASPSIIGRTSACGTHSAPLDKNCARLLVCRHSGTQMTRLESIRNGAVDESESEGNCTKRADRMLRLLGERGSQLGGRCDARMTMKNHKEHDFCPGGYMTSAFVLSKTPSIFSRSRLACSLASAAENHAHFDEELRIL